MSGTFSVQEQNHSSSPIILFITSKNNQSISNKVDIILRNARETERLL